MKLSRHPNLTSNLEEESKEDVPGRRSTFNTMSEARNELEDASEFVDLRGKKLIE